MEFRVIFDGYSKATRNMAIDEALLRMVGEVGPTLRFYGWRPYAVTIGYFQSIEEEVDLNVARSLGVDVVRRITGGGAVYHKWELTYSIAMPVPSIGVMESYRWIEKGIVESLKSLGLDAQLSGINDVVVNGRKISGNAQTRRFGGLLQHGTILMDLDVEEMFTLLKVPREKISDKMIRDVKKRVVSLKDLGIDVEFEELQKIFAEGFSKALGIHLYEENVPNEVMKLADTIEVERYARREWNHRR